jgi:hypothetical protein
VLDTGVRDKTWKTLNEKLEKDERRRMDANQAKMDANTKPMQEDMTANQEKADADRKADRENLKREKIEQMNASPKEMMVRMERMTNTNQTDVKLKNLTEKIKKKNTSGMREANFSLHEDLPRCNEGQSRKYGVKSRRNRGRSGATGDS